MRTKTHLEVFISHAREGEYFTLPFEMPPHAASVTLTYDYERNPAQAIPLEHGTFTPRVAANIIDLGLLAPDGSQVGASGSDKNRVTLSATSATPGYTPRPLTPGRWQILVGAYKVAQEGVTITYDLEFTAEALCLYKGDLHTHTLASDGVLTAEELATHARRHGLDFLAITDHNQAATGAALPHIEGMTLIPGVEWTHYRGHANFLGIDRPYDEPFFTNSEEETRARFVSARERGALIVIAHPFDEHCGFAFDLDDLPFDCLEVWNGPMRESNLRAVNFWLEMLAAGKKVPMTGGSDYHRDTLFQIVGGPCMGVYAMSASPQALLSAVREGHSFVTFSPQGPTLEMTCDGAILGDSVPWRPGMTVHLHVDGLKAGDVVKLVSAQGSQDVYHAPADGILDVERPIEAPGFALVQVWRTFLPGVPPLLALLSNPIYFEDRSDE